MRVGVTDGGDPSDQRASPTTRRRARRARRWISTRAPREPDRVDAEPFGPGTVVRGVEHEGLELEPQLAVPQLRERVEPGRRQRCAPREARARGAPHRLGRGSGLGPFTPVARRTGREDQHDGREQEQPQAGHDATSSDRLVRRQLGPDGTDERGQAGDAARQCHTEQRRRERARSPRAERADDERAEQRQRCPSDEHTPDGSTEQRSSGRAGCGPRVGGVHHWLEVRVSASPGVRDISTRRGT